MKYHDNEVAFVNGDNCQISGGKFTVTHFSITAGQDPKGHISKGMVLNFDHTGKMVFSVGRHSSEGVARWFNNKVGALNTFAEEAGGLNFAIQGDLEIYGTLQSYVDQTFVFNEVILAQGSTGFGANNWWFGGPLFHLTDKPGIITYTGGGPVSVSFYRGGAVLPAHVNQIRIDSPGEGGSSTPGFISGYYGDGSDLGGLSDPTRLTAEFSTRSESGRKINTTGDRVKLTDTDLAKSQTTRVASKDLAKKLHGISAVSKANKSQDADD